MTTRKDTLPLSLPPQAAGSRRTTGKRAPVRAPAQQTTGALIEPQHLPAGQVACLARGARLAPPLNATLGPRLIRGLLISSSLNLTEKDRVLSAMPTLSHWQVAELIKTFDDESREFAQLVQQEFEFIAKLQASALWSAAALCANRADTSPALERAWRRRTLRQAGRAGLHTRLQNLPADWWRGHAVARWAYRDLFGPMHVAWQT